MATRFISKFLPRQLPPESAVDAAIASIESSMTPVSQKDLMAQAFGILTQNADLGSASNTTVPTAGTMYATAIWVPGGATINNLLSLVGTAGVGTAPTAIFGGLADWSGHVVAQSDNLASNAMWTSIGLATIPLVEAPYTVSTEEAGLYYALFLQVGAFGTTPMALRRPTSWGGLAPNGVLGYGTAGTGLSALPADGTASGGRM